MSDFLKNTEFVKAATPPTFIMPNNVDCTPDVILQTNNIRQNITKIDVLPDIGSDHLSLLIHFDLQKPIAHATPTVKYKFNKCNVEKVNEEMLYYLESTRQNEISPETITNFNNKLMNVTLKNTPTNTNQCFTHKLPPYIIKLIKTKRKMFRDYQHQRDSVIKR